MVISIIKVFSAYIKETLFFFFFNFHPNFFKSRLRLFSYITSAGLPWIILVLEINPSV